MTPESFPEIAPEAAPEAAPEVAREAVQPSSNAKPSISDRVLRPRKKDFNYRNLAAR